MYVASVSDKEWLLSVQRTLYTRSWKNPDYVFRKLWGLITDLRNLRCSLARVARNKGSRTAGVDEVTVRMILKPENSGSFAPGYSHHETWSRTTTSLHGNTYGEPSA